MKIGLITNGHAEGTFSGRVNTREIEKLIIFNGGISRHSRDYSGHLDEIVSEFYSSSVGVVVSNGGDGTFQKVITSYIRNNRGRTLPKFVILRSGSMNILADAFDCSKYPKKAILNLTQSKVQGFDLGILKVSSKDEVNYGTLFASGAIYNFVKEQDNPHGGRKTRTKAGLFIVKSLLSNSFAESLLEPTISELYVDGEYRGKEHTSILASTYKINILKIKPFHWMPELCKGFYQGDNNFRAKEYFSNFLNFTLGNRVETCNYKIGTNHIYMRSDKEFGYTLDGELFTSKEINVEEGTKIELLRC